MESFRFSSLIAATLGRGEGHPCRHVHEPGDQKVALADLALRAAPRPAPWRWQARSTCRPLGGGDRSAADQHARPEADHGAGGEAASAGRLPPQFRKWSASGLVGGSSGVDLQDGTWLPGFRWRLSRPSKVPWTCAGLAAIFGGVQPQGDDSFSEARRPAERRAGWPWCRPPARWSSGLALLASGGEPRLSLAGARGGRRW